MEKENLYKIASLLKKPSNEACIEYASKSELLAELVNKKMGSRPDLETLIGKDNQLMMHDNHRNHARFISSFIQTFQPEVLVDTVLWVFRAYRIHGFNLTYWPAQLNAWVDVMKENLSEKTFQEIYPIYNFMIVHQPDFAKISDNMLAEN